MPVTYQYDAIREDCWVPEDFVLTELSSDSQPPSDASSSVDSDVTPDNDCWLLAL